MLVREIVEGRTRKESVEKVSTLLSFGARRVTAPPLPLTQRTLGKGKFARRGVVPSPTPLLAISPLSPIWGEGRVRGRQCRKTR